LYKNIGRTIDVKISVATMFMARQCNHGKGVCFIQKENWKGKNELKKIKEMMYATQKE
jgi:hypothetical protein